MKFFISVRVLIVLYTLLWLSINNILYKNVIINHREKANLENKFISKSVKDNIVLSPSNHPKHKDYTYDLSQNKLENDIHTTILNYNKLQLGLFNGCVFININGMCYHPILKIIFKMYNLVNINTEKTKPLIIYSSNGHFTCLNNWQDKYYFIGVFPTLFLFEDGRHLAKHKTTILL